LKQLGKYNIPIRHPMKEINPNKIGKASIIYGSFIYTARITK